MPGADLAVEATRAVATTAAVEDSAVTMAAMGRLVDASEATEGQAEDLATGTQSSMRSSCSRAERGLRR